MPWLARIAVAVAFAGLLTAPIAALADDPPPAASTVAPPPAPPVEVVTSPDPSAPSPPPPGQVVTIVLPRSPPAKAPAQGTGASAPATPPAPPATTTPDSQAAGRPQSPPAAPPPPAAAPPPGERGGPSAVLPLSIQGGRATVEIVPRSRRSAQSLPAGVVVREGGFLSGVPRWLLGLVALLGASQLLLLVRLAYRR